MIDQVESEHEPVLVSELVSAIGASRGGEFLDCTYGAGGHSRAILAAHPAAKVFAIDRDLRVIERVRTKIKATGSDTRLSVQHGNFAELQALVGGRQFNGVIADLGLITMQLREARGFSFSDDVSLDMRMDESQERDANYFVNQVSERELCRVLQRGGVGADSKRLARVIVAKRPVSTAKELASIVAQAQRRDKVEGAHPATVVFQALRIAVNEELDSIEQFLSNVVDVLLPGGRLAVICFHSLEDKIVTSRMRDWATGCTCPASRPCECGLDKLGTLLTKKAITPGCEEVQRNPASRSARLRVFEFSPN